MANDSFMMDVENQMLESWGGRGRPLFEVARRGNFPKGKGRVQDEAWAAHAKKCLTAWYGGGPSRREGGQAEVSWEEYVAWVEAGGGDEWFGSGDGSANGDHEVYESSTLAAQAARAANILCEDGSDADGDAHAQLTSEKQAFVRRAMRGGRCEVFVRDGEGGSDEDGGEGGSDEGHGIH